MLTTSLELYWESYSQQSNKRKDFPNSLQSYLLALMQYSSQEYFPFKHIGKMHKGNLRKFNYQLKYQKKIINYQLHSLTITYYQLSTLLHIRNFKIQSVFHYSRVTLTVICSQMTAFFQQQLSLCLAKPSMLRAAWEAKRSYYDRYIRPIIIASDGLRIADFIPGF